ncbi:MAG: hypothetical protein ACOCRX_06310 [Candidatus Woesearchaeota archaeon]
MLKTFNEIKKLNSKAEEEQKLIEEKFEEKFKKICKQYKKERSRIGLDEDANKTYSQLIGFHKAMDIILGEEKTSELIYGWYNEVINNKEVE